MHVAYQNDTICNLIRKKGAYLKKICQSCGMPLSKDPNHGGTKSDGSKTEKYCSYCYKNGEFTLSNVITTAKEMQKMCIKQMKKQGTPHFIAWLLTRPIPRLERWKKS